jgi:GH24 family phage-related lysozyme (muramidase)
MPNDNLVLSETGLERLKKTEGFVDGLYDDSSGYCTFGVGYLVHQREKWNCFLLEAASTDDKWKQYLLKQRPGKRKRYLTRPAVFADQISELKTKAIDIAKSEIALRKYRKAFDKLNKPEQEKVLAIAKNAVDEQAKLLAKSPVHVLQEDVKPFERAVRAHIAANLTQHEFDALVSFCFNVGTSALTKSLGTEIDKNKHRSGTEKDRKTAIQAIETAFLRYNKSKGVVVDGLTKRRKAEADQFLAKARTELLELQNKTLGPIGLAPWAPGPKP